MLVRPVGSSSGTSVSCSSSTPTGRRRRAGAPRSVRFAMSGAGVPAPARRTLRFPMSPETVRFAATTPPALACRDPPKPAPAERRYVRLLAAGPCRPDRLLAPKRGRWSCRPGRPWTSLRKQGGPYGRKSFSLEVLQVYSLRYVRRNVREEGQMDVLTLASVKGGGGKSTLCAHISVEADRQGDGPVAVIDTDPQASLARWWNARQAETPAFVQITLAELPQQVEALRSAGFKLVVIDTPGADVSHTRTVLRHSDLVLIPSRPSPLDLGTLEATVGMVEAGSRPLMFVLNAVTPRTRISAQAIMALSQSARW